MSSNHSNKIVSVIVPTYNSGSTISACLESIKLQTHPFIETIIVDCFSSDSTISESRKYGCKIIQTKLKRSSARNVGASIAIGDFLMFVDSDMELEPTITEEAVKRLESDRYDCLIVPEVSKGEGFWSECIALEKKLYINNQLVESPCFFTKSCFQAMGGYDRVLEAGEDWDIFNRLLKNRFRVGRINGLIFHNDGHTTLKKLFLKKYYYGQTIDLYSKTNPRLSRVQLSPKRFVNSKSVKTILQVPWVGIGLIFMKSVEFSGLVFGSRFRRRT